MSEPEPITRNERWTRILLAADAGGMHPRDAIVEAQEHYETVYGSNFGTAVRMLEELAAAIEEVRARVNDSTAHQAAYAHEQEAVKSLLSDFRADFHERVDTLGEHLSGRLDQIEMRLDGQDTRLSGHDAIIEDFRRSRDLSIAQRELLEQGRKENRQLIVDFAERSEERFIHSEERLARIEAQLDRLLARGHDDDAER